MNIKQYLINYNIPSSWQLIELKEILRYIKGKKPKNLGEQNKSRIIPYINIEAFEKGTFTRYSDELIYPMCKSSDVLIVWDGARCGLVGKGVEGIIGSTLAKLECNNIHSSYLFYFLQSKYEFINKRPRGVGIPHVDPNIFWNILFPLPPLNEQNRIVTKLEELFTKLDAGIEYLKKNQILLKQYRHSVLKSAFEGKLTEECRNENDIMQLYNNEISKTIPGWKKIILGEHIYIAARIGWRGLKKEEYQKEGALFISVREIMPDGKINYNVTDYLSEFRYNESPEIQLKNNDILISKDGSGIGKVGFVENLPSNATVNSSILVVRPSTSIMPKYLFHYFRGPALQEIIRKKIAGTAVPHLFQHDIKKFELTIPSLNEQNIILNKIEKSLSIINNIENIINNYLLKIKLLRNLLLKDAFEGKLVSQNPNDEPTEILLEKIKRERESTLQIKKEKSKITKKKSIEHDGKQMRLM